MDDIVKIHKGIYYQQLQSPRSSIEKCSKAVVFDVDETFGYFFDLKILWDCLVKINIKYDTQHHFNQLLNLFPEFLRYGILPILDYLYRKKKTSDCFKIYVYTNNKFEKEWVNHILNYFSYKLNCQTNQLFDHVIYAFKLNNKIIEPIRTTNSKTFGDFIKCTMLPVSTEICFIDNNYFPGMKNERVYYIQPFSYYHDLTRGDVVKRFINSTLWLHNTYNDTEYKKDIHSFLQLTPKPENIRKLMKTNIDTQVAKKMMYNIKEFFYFPSKKNKTRKNNIMLKRVTRKKYVNVL